MSEPDKSAHLGRGVPEMPATNVHVIAAKDARKGDVLTDAAGVKNLPVTIERKDVKTAYTYLISAEGRTIRVSNDLTIAVERVEKTEDERAAERYSLAIETLTDSLAFWT